MGRVDSDKFLTELNKLFERNKDKGSVFITMKRTNEVPKSGKKNKAAAAGAEYKCLVRATDGKKKFSAVLQGKELIKFKDSYDTIMKAHMDALKKRERRRPKKTT